jgi:hypothetical protein
MGKCATVGTHSGSTLFGLSGHERFVTLVCRFQVGFGRGTSILTLYHQGYQSFGNSRSKFFCERDDMHDSNPNRTLCASRNDILLGFLMEAQQQRGDSSS